ncbi:MAG TPA: heterodisulfide reductase-related iron-sulfur binding cluster [Gaiellaceae bacterium]|nr:heterodisulfide reductase-related iron-sulfur binding cluster [Gaiellaceae bacterium]
MQPELIADCVHCGFCLPTCPTYTLWREEMDSPRGRIQLMGGLADGTLELTDTVVRHFDRCLGCMACVTACPSGVQYDRLIESTRAHVEQHHRRGLGDRLVRAAIFAVFPHRRRLRAALALRNLPAPGPLRPLKRLAPPWSDPSWPPAHLPGRGPRVAIVAGCVQSVVFGGVNAATARVLAADGYDVHVPRAQGCCGALHAHAGRPDEGVKRARDLEHALAGYDAIVTNAAGCGSHLKDHGIANTADVSELLAAAPTPAERQPLELRVALQDPCHLKHAQRIESQPRAMLAAIPALELVEPGEQELCCGSAGIYNITQPQTAAALGDRKAAQLLATRPDAYASGNPGCLVQVTAALRRANQPTPAFHPIELVDASIRGIGAAELLAAARR